MTRKMVLGSCEIKNKNPVLGAATGGIARSLPFVIAKRVGHASIPHASQPQICVFRVIPRSYAPPRAPGAAARDSKMKGEQTSFGVAVNGG